MKTKRTNPEKLIADVEKVRAKFRPALTRLRAAREARNLNGKRAALLAKASSGVEQVLELADELVRLALKLRLKRSLARAAHQERGLKPEAITDAQRRAQAARLGEKIYKDAVAGWLKEKVS